MNRELRRIHFGSVARVMGFGFRPFGADVGSQDAGQGAPADLENRR